MIAVKFQAKGMNRDKAPEIASLRKQQYYHQPSDGSARGRPKTRETLKMIYGEEVLVNNQALISELMKIDSDPDLSCGSKRMTFQLHLLGYVINKKKVARLTKENGLTKRGRSQAK